MSRLINRRKRLFDRRAVIRAQTWFMVWLGLGLFTYAVWALAYYLPILILVFFG